MSRGRKHRTKAKTKNPLSREALADSAFSIACGLENEVQSARQFVAAIELICETMDNDGKTEVVQRLAWTISARLRAVEEMRSQLFDMTHRIVIGELPPPPST